MQSSLEFVLLMLGTAVIGVVVFRYLQLPSILGYLAVGVVIGPHSTGLVSDAQSLEGLAEFGVVFLMFTVGLEFSLSQLLAMRRIVFGLGLAQVSTSIIGSIIITLVIAITAAVSIYFAPFIWFPSITGLIVFGRSLLLSYRCCLVRYIHVP